MKPCNWLQRWWHARKRALSFSTSTRSGPEWRCQCGVRFRSSQEYRNGLMLLLSNSVRKSPSKDTIKNPRYF